MHAPPNLPEDIASLKQLIVEQRALLYTRQVEIDKLKVQLARLRRLHFGRSSEQLDQSIAQLELSLEELEARGAAFSASARAAAERAVHRTGAPASACTSAARTDRAHAKLHLS